MYLNVCIYVSIKHHPHHHSSQVDLGVGSVGQLHFAVITGSQDNINLILICLGTLTSPPLIIYTGHNGPNAVHAVPWSVAAELK